MAKGRKATLAMPHARRYATDTSTAASWRRGYAADCKAAFLSNKNSTLPQNRCPDIPGTQGEPDNHQKSDLTTANENPGALAGASGADLHTSSLLGKPYHMPPFPATVADDDLISRIRMARIASTLHIAWPLAQLVASLAWGPQHDAF
ncbi:hypothetical protein GC209_14395 [bacterium]|nr:hypothetical protein [bacterium]